MRENTTILRFALVDLMQAIRYNGSKPHRNEVFPLTDFSRYILYPFGPVPNERHIEWYRRGRTAFLHFTVNTFTGREWGDGTESPQVFAPTALDCRQWVRVLKAAGFTAAILTAKHHDGFCLWHTDTTAHSVRNSPCQVDVVREFTDACREQGLKAGLYLSPWDRNHPAWGREEYNDVYAAQLTELMTRYGPIWECWWDGAGSTTAHYDWARWSAIIRKYQPQCVIFGCLGAAEYVDVRWVGTEEGRAGENCWATIDRSAIVMENCADLNSGKWNGRSFIPAETNTSIRPGWFWHESQNDQVRSPENLVRYWFESAGRNTAILLNLPPDRRGLLHERDVDSVLRWSELLNTMFAEDLAPAAAITADEAAHPDCGPENLLVPEEDRFYAAGCLTPEITLRFERPVTFDCWQLEEVLELGHRIRRFAVDARESGAWKTIARGECIGFCRCARMEPVKASALRIRILEAGAAPVLRRVRLYDTKGVGLEHRRDPVPGELTGLTVSREGDSITVELGGIYPYNEVAFAGTGPVEIQAFNGTRYEPVWTGSGTCAEFDAVTGSYRLKILGNVDPDSVRVFFR